MLRKQKEEKLDHLPCAGITLSRFYGYILSRFSQHPEESVDRPDSGLSPESYLFFEFL
jgi:hypothetical protein